MPTAKNILAQPLDPGERPTTCQAGHPIVWLLDGTEANGDGCLLGVCECAVRKEDGRTDRHNMSTPNLWRYVPPRGRILTGRLTAYFPSMSRTTFALAVRLYRLLQPPSPAGMTDAALLIRQATHALRQAPRPSVGPIPGPEAL